ncbi:MAG: tyrosine-type recombinase/integrase, partial [Chloroflexota bacterium]|nr:tyrosine-type recombinase/integrase [Chloroflexota bacterium]
IDRSPATKIQPLGKVVRAPIVLTPQRRNRLLWTGEKLGRGADYPLIMTLAHTGVREGELVSLNLINMVPIQTDTGWRYELVVMGKGGKQRTIPIATVLEEVLVPYLLKRLDATGTDPQAPLFISARGTRYTTSAIQKKVKSYGKKSDIPGLHPHMLRHTFATEAIEATGKDWKVVKELLGHASVKTTLDIYDHPSPERMQRGVERTGECQKEERT